ncbi:alpha/beta fold hydrolase [Thalassiella azotivora]
MRRHLLALLAALAVLLAGLGVPAGATTTGGAERVEAAGGHGRPAAPRPVVFVHGSSGSASQFETQAQRLASNGYPVSWVEAHEYDSTFTTTSLAQVHAGLQARVDALRERTGVEQVDLVAHSLGTFVVQRYLTSTAERAAAVAHYVNLDGAPADGLPGGVPTLAVWAEANPDAEVVGARNVHLDDQAHTEVVTSPETFAEVHRFLTGRAPRTTAVVPERGPVDVSGRVVLFPTNVGAEGTTLTVHRVSALTGRRVGRPAATVAVGADGAFGPLRLDPRARYELAVTHPQGQVHHFYRQPLLRSTALLRLLTGVPGTGLDAVSPHSERHVNLTVSRNREWWGDQGTAGDRLLVDGLDVLAPAVAPRQRRVIGVFVVDDGADGVSTPGHALPAFQLPFLTGVDAYVPADPRARRTVLVQVRPRGGHGRVQTVAVPAWPSSGHRVSVQVDDHLQSARWAPLLVRP